MADTPNVRFGGFTNAWEQRKFKDVCSLITVGIANSATHAYVDDGIAMFRNQNIKENYLDDEDLIHINSEFEEKYSNKRLKKNDLLIARTGYPGTACVVPEKYENSQTFTTLIARLNDGINPYYACQYINSDIGKAYFLSTQIGGGQKNSGAGILEKMPLIIPPTEDEQNRIANFLGKMDKLISFNQRKCDEVKGLKKYMLQKMFPQNGKRIPEIRFAGFRDDWEQRKIFELFKITRGYVLAASETEEKSSDEKLYPVYSSQTKDNGLMGYYSDYLYEDAITWTTDGANAGTVNYRAGKFYCTNVCGVLLSDEGYANKMVAEALNAIAWKHVSRVGNPKLMNNVMAEIEICLPISITEQKQIADYFDKIDNIVTLHQHKCDQLKEVKKFMLQNMFPQKG